jgi:hypothetical protein
MKGRPWKNLQQRTLCCRLFLMLRAAENIHRAIMSTIRLRNATCPDKIFNRAAIDLGKKLKTTAPGRPFDLEHVTRQRRRIEVAFTQKSHDPLPAPLPGSRLMAAAGRPGLMDQAPLRILAARPAPDLPRPLSRLSRSTTPRRLSYARKARPDGRAVPEGPALAGDRPGCRRSTYSWVARAAINRSIAAARRASARAASAAGAAPQFGGHKITDPVVEPGGQHDKPRVSTGPPFCKSRSVSHRLLLGTPPSTSTCGGGHR